MILSFLQKSILFSCLEKGGKVERGIFRQFYAKQAKKPAEKYLEGIITKSLERLIDKEFLIGYGRRTLRKWFITHVKLTQKGIKKGHKLLKERQKKLPLK